jgi:hypothetical protein
MIETTFEESEDGEIGVCELEVRGKMGKIRRGNQLQEVWEGKIHE